MDFRTKYYRPNLAKGTAGAAKTTPTPIRRSAIKWAMPIDGGGSGGGDRGIIAITVSPEIPGWDEFISHILPITDYESEAIDTSVLTGIVPKQTYMFTVTPAPGWYVKKSTAGYGGDGETITIGTMSKTDTISGLKFEANNTGQSGHGERVGRTFNGELPK